MPLSRMVRTRLRFKLHVVRRRLRKRRVIQAVPKLDAKNLRSCSLFAKWPLEALSDLRRRMLWEVHLKGETILYGGEPCSVSSLFWIASGRLSEVPNRREKSGTRRPSNKEEEGVASMETVGSAEHSSVSPHVEFDQTLDTFSAGQFAAGERLFLGATYHRTMRCESDVTGFAVSFRTVQKIQKKWGVPREASVSAAKEIVKKQMLRRDEKPLLKLALFKNRVLRGLDATTLRIIWVLLSPMVVCANELICADIFDAENISFIQSGDVRVGFKRGQQKEIILSCGSAVGLQSFAPSEMPRGRGEGHTAAVAVTFSQLWSVGRKAFSEMVSEREWEKCAAIALRTIYFHVDDEMLRKVAIFSLLPRSKIMALAKRAELRFVRGDEYILPPWKRPQEAIVVLVGTVYFTQKTPAEEALNNGKMDRIRIPCGYPVAFAECVARMPLKSGVFAATGALIVSLTRRAMLESLSENAAGNDIEPVVLEAAMNQLNVSPSSRSATRIVNKAQEEALQDMRNYSRPQNGNLPPWKNELQDLCSPNDDVGEMIELHTQVLSTLALQVHKLRPNMEKAGRVGVHYDNASRIAMKKISTNESPSCHRSRSCFTIDKKGRVMFCSKGAIAERKTMGRVQPTDVLSGTEGNREIPRQALPICLPVKNGLSKASQKLPSFSALRCAPSEKLAAVVGHSPVSQKVMELRHEGKRLKDEAESNCILPLDCFLPNQRHNNPHKYI
ncbi:hypothetical protein C3747_131g54 [Trypanosoma cruzi]|uniref:Cyclic nucleotide-binding domain-containing protein n=2 Tax=Trypanosoma cruzi TaxID=5693 RepID=Q4DUV7_TRYCC|nr:hypothetical protein, conserved [Trypanosoma cruzi]EAN96325.1 hypothetical protein, conserved [Trypanosoma cruzi]PWV05442.1 hypothetical protein C3747_131g54 [Trypanosoma cruzi]|eukprot:XP_818176.1 hypothetical protein [Trypanosoma cruzi strain CL Brener]